MHPDERLLEELRERQRTSAGRKKLRERVGVEHSLAHIGTGRATEPATGACARTSWTSDAQRWCTTCT